MRVVSTVVCAVAALWVCLAPAHAERRVALVVGNNNYTNLPPAQQLKTAVNDARAVSSALAGLGFEVIRGENLSRSAFSTKLDELTRTLSPGDTALVYFAGHGVSLGGGNYLLPSDVPGVESGQESLLARASLAEDDIVGDIQERGARVVVVMLDACRNNPFKRSGQRSVGGERGLSRIEAARGVFKLYSAGIGQSALDRLSNTDTNPNSVFTRVLVPELVKPGLDLTGLAKEVGRQVLRLALTVGHEQQPAYYDQILDSVYLAGAPSDNQKKATSVTPAVSEAERAWLETKNTTNQTVLEEFIRRFGDNYYASLARDRLQELQKSRVATGVTNPGVTTPGVTTPGATNPAVTAKNTAAPSEPKDPAVSTQNKDPAGGAQTKDPARVAPQNKDTAVSAEHKDPAVSTPDPAENKDPTSRCIVVAPAYLATDNYIFQYQGGCQGGRAEGKGKAIWTLRYAPEHHVVWEGTFNDGVYLPPPAGIVSAHEWPHRNYRNTVVFDMGTLAAQDGILAARLKVQATSSLTNYPDPCAPTTAWVTNVPTATIVSDSTAQSLLAAATNKLKAHCGAQLGIQEKRADGDVKRTHLDVRIVSTADLETDQYGNAGSVIAEARMPLSPDERIQSYHNQAGYQQRQKQELMQKQEEREVNAQRLRAFFRAHQAEGWASLDDIAQNPFRYAGRVVVTTAQLGRVISPTRATLYLSNDRSGARALLDGDEVAQWRLGARLLAVRVTGRTKDDDDSFGGWAQLQLVGSEACTDRGCWDWLNLPVRLRDGQVP